MSTRALLAAAFLSAALAAVPAAARAVTFVVESTVDAVDASPGDGVCADATGACTLRAAVQETNALAGADEIELPAGTYTLAIPPVPEDPGAGGALFVSDDLVLSGAGSAVTTIDAAGIDQVLVFLGAWLDAELIGVAITGGAVPGGQAGGGIVLLGYTQTLRDVDVHGNSAGNGGGLVALGGQVSLVDSLVRDNVARESGGGIFVYFGQLSLSASVVLGNSAGGVGGGIAAAGPVIATNSTVSANSAAAGGGLYSPCLNGGGVPCCGSDVSLSNATITGNEGGGLEVYLGYCVASFTMANSIVGSQVTGPDCYWDGPVSGGHNIDSDGSCNLTDPTDLPNTDPLLGPLQDNGGPTWTHALQLGSPAIDAIPPEDCTYDDDGDPGTPEVPLTEDQRGVARPLTGDGAPPTGCDIGAYEVTQCADGLHNDGDGRIDFDGGVTAGLPPEEQTEPDLQCVGPLDKREKSRCGLGFELVLVLAVLLGRRHVAAQATVTSR